MCYLIQLPLTSSAMLTYCIRRQLSVLNRLNVKVSVFHELLQLSKYYGSSNSDGVLCPAHDMLQLLKKRFFIPPNYPNTDTLMRSDSCPYGPLGVDLNRNILEQWWTSVVRSRPQVFGISTLYMVDKEAGKLEMEAMNVLSQTDLNKEQLPERQSQVLQHKQSFRSSLLQGALEQYVPSLELMNRKLPLGLAETGLCYRPESMDSHAIGCSSEVTEASLVWFCSPRTSSQWLDYWTRQRLQWWRKFVLGPSDFSVRDMSDEELTGGASRGVAIQFQFPWGTETLETLWSLGDTELLRIHQGTRANLQCKDGKKTVVPHVLSLSANMDRGMLAVFYNSLQKVQRVDSKQRLHQRTVLKLHPTLAPVKVAVDMGRGSTTELRQVCEGLLDEFLEVGISAWPGYMDTTQLSMETLHNKYDEMGVLFTVMVGENTLENGLLLVRNRDTTIRETMHISEIKQFLLKYISAAGNV
ncbi:DNA polymerase subunit gamma-2, mitochondrial [Trichomycterus rosablanca]|uniref:DNA polymerase subunit gamma-2, mitochondrial n=1 Tax=Trichomycterus rosablanca TaxID=2290929 RepID=UPI002F35E8B9